jgi:hypothetical protein
LKQAMRDESFLDTMVRGSQYASARGTPVPRIAHVAKGYSALIQAYVAFLKSKLDFHKQQPEFTANMDYAEYRALKKVDDLNEGFAAFAGRWQSYFLAQIQCDCRIDDAARKTRGILQANLFKLSRIGPQRVPYRSLGAGRGREL